MKKALIIISSVLSAVLICVILYNFVWIKSVSSLSPDSDRGNYSTNYTSYYSGIVTAVNLQSNCIEVFENGNKKSVSLEQFECNSANPQYDGKYWYEIKNFGYAVYDSDGTKKGDILAEEKIKFHANDEVFYYGASKNSVYKFDFENLTCELIFTTDDFEINNMFSSDNFLFIEYQDDSLNTSTILKYNAENKKVSEKHEIDISMFDIDKEDKYFITKQDNLFYYEILNNKSLSDRTIYRFDISAKNMKYLVDICDVNALRKDNYLYYYGTVSDYGTETVNTDNSDKKGLCRYNIDTRQAEFISDDLTENSIIFCTENYAYAYEISSIDIFPYGGTAPDIEIYRGYNLKQIPLN